MLCVTEPATRNVKAKKEDQPTGVIEVTESVALSVFDPQAV